MLTAPEVIIHDIKDRDRYPEDVLELLSQLMCPFPKHLTSNEVRGRLSPFGRQMYDEALRSPIFVLEKGKDSQKGRIGRPVTDVVDSVLTSVCMEKALVDKPECKRGDHSTSIWTSMFAFLAFAIGQSAFFSQNIPFLKPRTRTKREVHKLEDLEGHADILLSVLIPRHVRPYSFDDTSSKGSQTYLDTSSTMAPSERSFATLDIPSDSHMLPGRGKRVDCRLPVICAANEDEIQDLVISTVCQRHVWGISLPVVGLLLPKTGTVSSIVIGWATVENNDSPIIHIASAQNCTEVHPSLGRFDFLDPASMLYFAQFILWLQPYFSSIREAIANPQFKNFCWRLDHVGYGHSHPAIDLPSESDFRIDSWLNSFPSAGNVRNVGLDISSRSNGA